MNSPEAARLLGISQQAVTKAIRQQRLPAERRSRHWYIRPEDVAAYIPAPQRQDDRVCQDCGATFHRHYLSAATERRCPRCRDRVYWRRKAGMTDAGTRPRRCEWCGQAFAARRADQAYCSTTCRVRAFYQRHPDRHQALSARYQALTLSTDPPHPAPRGRQTA